MKIKKIISAVLASALAAAMAATAMVSVSAAGITDREQQLYDNLSAASLTIGNDTYKLSTSDLNQLYNWLMENDITDDQCAQVEAVVASTTDGDAMVKTAAATAGLSITTSAEAANLSTADLKTLNAALREQVYAGVIEAAAVVDMKLVWDGDYATLVRNSDGAEMYRVHYTKAFVKVGDTTSGSDVIKTTGSEMDMTSVVAVLLAVAAVAGTAVVGVKKAKAVR